MKLKELIARLEKIAAVEPEIEVRISLGIFSPDYAIRSVAIRSKRTKPQPYLELNAELGPR